LNDKLRFDVAKFEKCHEDELAYINKFLNPAIKRSEEAILKLNKNDICELNLLAKFPEEMIPVTKVILILLTNEKDNLPEENFKKLAFENLNLFFDKLKIFRTDEIE
jgi:hypothetical protein